MLKVFVYVDGSDLDEISSQLAEAFTNFLSTWGVSSARLVNDKFPRTANLRDDDLPDWNLGLNFEAERLSPTEFDQLISFLSQTAAETQREFVVGGYGPKRRFENSEATMMSKWSSSIGARHVVSRATNTA
jgi:hypothetical protein